MTGVWVPVVAAALIAWVVALVVVRLVFVRTPSVPIDPAGDRRTSDVGASARAHSPALARGGVAWGTATLVWVALSVVGSIDCSWQLAALPAVLCAAGFALGALVPRALEAHPAAGVVLRAAVLVSAVKVALFLLEHPYNARLYDMDPAVMRLNLALVGAAMLAVWLLCRRRMGAAVAFAAVCLGIGLANYFVCAFKGQTILPADVLALQTAAAVAAGYSYVLDAAAVEAVAEFAGFAALALACPAPLLPAPGPRRRIATAAHVVAGLGVAALLVNWYGSHDLAKDYGVKVDVWATRASYEQYGTVPAFLQRLQEVTPDPPAGYGADAAAEIQADLAASWDQAHPAYLAAADAAVADTRDDEPPCIVAIMNESFSDLSVFGGLDGYEGLGAFWACGAQETGWAYTGARGGGTCNSEFEYLTGSTLGFIGGGVYPYMFYDLAGCESLPSYLGSLGYATHAIHPAEPQNWRRDVVYRQLGFDDFISEDAFADAERLRGLVTDAATYDVVLDLLADDSAPQFVFDVTIQNHGGYTTGQADTSARDDVRVRGEQIEGMAEYLTCMDASLENLRDFLDTLSGLDRRVLLVFFGDHQPGFNDAAAEAAWGIPVSDESLAQVQTRFVTPYLIWANYELEDYALDALGEVGMRRAEDGGDASTAADKGGATYEDAEEGGIAGSGTHATDDVLEPSLDQGLSLGYLMARTAVAAGLPLTEYQRALLALEQGVPAVNLNGWCGADWDWRWNGQAGDAQDLYDDYRLIQYANLFDERGNAAG